MKRAILRAPREFQFEDLDLDPQAMASHEVYAETEYSAVSIGTETAAYMGLAHLRAGVTYPRLIGYCNVARVMKIGAEVSGVKVGQRILTHQSHQSAFICPQTDVLIVLSGTVSPATASLAYLAQLGLASLQKADFRPGEHVGILGLGVVGLGAVGVAAALGARVIAIGNDAFRLAKAREAGAHTCVHYDDPEIGRQIAEATNGVGIDLLITTANSWAAWRTALEVMRTRGRIAVLGFPGRGEGPPSFNPLDPWWFYAKQLSILATGSVSELQVPPSDIRFTLQRNMELVVSLMEEGRLRLDPLITHRVPWHELVNIYELATRKEKSLIGAVLDWSK